MMDDEPIDALPAAITQARCLILALPNDFFFEKIDGKLDFRDLPSSIQVLVN